MSQVTSPILLNSTGQDISTKLKAIATAINGGTIDPLTVTQNGTYTPSGTTLGYGPVTVNVGGAGENAYAYNDPPSASIGQDGEYYFDIGGLPGILKGSLDKNANTGIAGWELKVNTNMLLVGLRGHARDSYNGTIKFGDLNGVIVEKSITLVANQWSEVTLDTPIQLTAGTSYIVMVFGNSNTLSWGYAAEPYMTINPKVMFVRARYGSYPGSIESGHIYAADVVLREVSPPYPIRRQYYKTGGVWVQV